MTSWNPCPRCGADSYYRWVYLAQGALCLRCRCHGRLERGYRTRLKEPWVHYCVACDRELQGAAWWRRHQHTPGHLEAVRSLARVLLKAPLSRPRQLPVGAGG
jgi:hypothetical protein